jgi:hypothetical protein
MINLHPENADFLCVSLFTKELFAKSKNPAMPISSRRYLSIYKNVIKYLVFAEKNADFYELSGVNTKYLITA